MQTTNNKNLSCDDFFTTTPDENQNSRTERLIGQTAVSKLCSAKIAIFGLGGVGSYVLEALARVGVGNFVLVDSDHIVKSNINRQLLALHSSIDRLKTECAKERVIDINPDAKVECFPIFYIQETATQIATSLEGCSYIIDAIDTVSAKILLVQEAARLNIPIISCMGTGNKLDPSRFEVADIYKTSVCPLARVMRRELKARGIQNLKVVYSKENPQNMDSFATADSPTNICPQKTFSDKTCTQTKKRQPPASISFVPAAAGLLLAGEVIKDILCQKSNKGT